MSEKLLEADFLTVDIKSVFNNQKSADEVTLNAPSGQQRSDNNNNLDTQEVTSAQRIKRIDWGKELKNRLNANRQMSQESRQSEYAIESKFFTEFFKAVWGDELAKQLLLLGEPLRKAFKVLGFVENINPIYKFLTLDYVKTNLLKTKLLNVNTFKAIYNAVAKRLVADSEFFKANNYNLIYCTDLYKQTVSDMEAYLKLQSEILSTKASSYTAEMRNANKRVFLYVETNTEKNLENRAKEQKKIPSKMLPSMMDTEVKLNSYDFAEVIKNSLNITERNKADGATTHLSAKAQGELAKKLTTPAQILAAIQFLSMTTASEEAKRALSNERLGRVTTDNLLKATNWLAAQKIMPKGQLKTSDADALVGILLSKL